jgi:hypothetical protein
MVAGGPIGERSAASLAGVHRARFKSSPLAKVTGARVTFRTITARLHAWLRRLDRWIAYANSVVEE